MAGVRRSVWSVGVCVTVAAVGVMSTPVAFANPSATAARVVKQQKFAAAGRGVQAPAAPADPQWVVDTVAKTVWEPSGAVDKTPVGGRASRQAFFAAAGCRGWGCSGAPSAGVGHPKFLCDATYPERSRGEGRGEPG